MSAIKNRKFFDSSHYDWGPFNAQCFPGTNITVGDVDGITSSIDPAIEYKPGIVHRFRRFLLLEAKRFVPRPPPGKVDAQDWYHSDLVKYPFTVLRLYGETNRPTSLQLWREFESKPDLLQPASLESAIAEVRRWFMHANTHPIPAGMPIQNFEAAMRIVETAGYSVRKMHYRSWLTRELN